MDVPAWTLLIGPIAALLGAAVGGVIGWITAMSVQKRNQQHEDRTRFHNERRELYARLLTDTHEYKSKVRLWVIADESEAAREQDAVLAALKGAATQLLKVLGSKTEISLIASEPVLAAADKLFEACWLQVRLGELVPGDPDVIEQAMLDFREASRAELRV